MYLVDLLTCRCGRACTEQRASALKSIFAHKAPSPSTYHKPCDLLLLCAEGINCGLDFKKALKDSEDQQLVKFQGSPQVSPTLSSQMAGPTPWKNMQAGMQRESAVLLVLTAYVGGIKSSEKEGTTDVRQSSALPRSALHLLMPGSM